MWSILSLLLSTMPKLPTLTAFKLSKILLKNGFVFKRSSGSHQTFYNQATKHIVTIPMHRGKDLGKGITKAIIQDAGFTEKEFLELI